MSRDAPIVPAKEQHLPDHLQYGYGTSPVTKFFGEQTNLYNGYKLELHQGKKVKRPEDFDLALYQRLI